MSQNSMLLKQCLQGKKISRPPFWFMRQAGRSLPEYRELRSRYKNFMEFCYTPDAASEATLQPIKRFDMDAAIIFSDILVIPHALGQDVSFVTGEGPKLPPIRNAEDAKKIELIDVKKLAPVYEAIRLTRSDLAKEKSLIGFAGAPWTLLCYMVEGGSSRNFSEVKKLMREQPEVFLRLTDKLIEAVSLHAINQIDAGIDVFQLFDSWAGVLSDKEYEDWVIQPATKIINKIKSHHPDIPIIAFPKQSGNKFLRYAKQTGADAVSVDDSVSLDWLRDTLQPEIILQGCLHPEMLTGDKNVMLKEAERIVETFKDKPFVFNLGHGILPQTPVENIQALCRYLKDVQLAA